MSRLTDWFQQKRKLADAIDAKASTVSFDLSNPMTVTQTDAKKQIHRDLIAQYNEVVDIQVRQIRAQYEQHKMAAKLSPIKVTLPVDITVEMRESILREYVRNTGKYGDVAAEDIQVHVDFIPQATIKFTAKEVGFVLADLKLRGLKPGDAE